MAIYIATWFIFTFFSFIELNTFAISRFIYLNKVLLGACFILLVFQVGLRWETATDWYSYLNFFQSQGRVDFFSDVGKFEQGYVYFNRIINLFSGDYSIFLLIHSLIFFGLLFTSFREFNSYVILTIFLYFSINIGMTGSNRQLLAVVIGLFGVTKLLEGKKLLFFTLVGIAFLFHTTALLLIIYYFLNRRFNNWLLVIVVLLSVLIGYSGLPQKLFSLVGGLNEGASDKVEAYLDLSAYGDAGGSIVGILKRIVLTVVFIFSSKKIGDMDRNYFICLNGFIVSIVFFFVFKSVPIMGGRAILYFNIMEPVLMCYLLYLFKDYALRNLIVFIYAIMAVFYFYQSINQYPEIFIPYKGIFINETYDRGRF